jgi:hypothetical protein
MEDIMTNLERKYNRMKLLYAALGNDKKIWDNIPMFQFRVCTGYVLLISSKLKMAMKLTEQAIERLGCTVYDIVESLIGRGATLFVDPPKKDNVCTVPHLRTV